MEIIGIFASLNSISLTIMKYHTVIAIILTLVLATGCRDKNIGRNLCKAEAYLPNNIDSAAYFVNKTNYRTMNDAEKALYHLLRAEINHLGGRRVNDNASIVDAYAYYQDESEDGSSADRQTLRHFAKSCYLLAIHYSQQDSTKRSEDLLRKSIAVSRGCNDWHTFYCANNVLSQRMVWSNPKEAVSIAKDAMMGYDKVKDSEANHIAILQNLAYCLSCDGKVEEALVEYNKALALAADHNDAQLMHSALLSMSYLYKSKGDHRLGLDYAKRAFSCGLKRYSEESLLGLADYFFQCDSLAQASKVLKVCVETKNITVRSKAYTLLAKVCMKQHEYDKANKYYDYSMAYAQKAYLKGMAEKNAYYKANIEHEKEEREIAMKAFENKMIFYGIITILVISLLFSIKYYMMRKETMRLKHLQEIAEKDKEIAVKEDEIEHKSDMIKTQQAVITRQTHDRANIQKHIADAKSGLISNLLSQDNTDDAESRFWGRRDKIICTDNDWANIEHLLDDTDNGYMRALRTSYPNFSEDDYRLCMLIRLNLTNDEIGRFFDIQKPAVQKRKLKLKKDGFGVTDKDVYIEQILTEFTPTEEADK